MKLQVTINTTATASFRFMLIAIILLSHLPVGVSSEFSLSCAVDLVFVQSLRNFGLSGL